MHLGSVVRRSFLVAWRNALRAASLSLGGVQRLLGWKGLDILF